MLLQNKTATVYTYARNANMVSSYTAGDSFKCNIQPVSTKDGFEWAMMYKVRKMYTGYSWLKVGDKLVIDSVNYVVNNFGSWEWTRSKYLKVFIQKSEGT